MGKSSAKGTPGKKPRAAAKKSAAASKNSEKNERQNKLSFGVSRMARKDKEKDKNLIDEKNKTPMETDTNAEAPVEDTAERDRISQAPVETTAEPEQAQQQEIAPDVVAEASESAESVPNAAVLPEVLPCNREVEDFSSHAQAEGKQDKDTKDVCMKMEPPKTPPRALVARTSNCSSAGMPCLDEVQCLSIDAGHERGFEDRKSILQMMFKWSWHAMMVLAQFFSHPERQAGQAKHIEAKIASSVVSECSKYPAVAPSHDGAFPVTFSEAEMRSLNDIKESLRSFSMSTSFSGVDTPSTAYLQLMWGVQSALGCDEESIDSSLAKNTFAVEISPQAREELLHHPHGPQCVFGDICDFFTPAVKDRLPVLVKQGMVQEVLVPLIQSGKAVVDHAHCYRHGKECKVQPCKAHIAGSSCVDYSARGLCMGNDGPTFLAFLCWIAMRLLLQEEIIVHENVEGFSTSTLLLYLGHLYEAVSVILSPTFFGWGCSRNRRYTILRHKKKTSNFKSDFSVFASLFRAEPWYGLYNDEISSALPVWDYFFCSSSKDLYEELMWASGRPGCKADHLQNISEKDMEKKLHDGEFTMFWEALNDGEKNALDIYTQKDDTQVFSLNQNPQFSETKSSWKTLHCITKNAGVMWSGFHQRWLTSKEAMLVMGMPVYTWLSGGYEMCPFTEQGLNRRNNPFARSQMIGFAGNAMHCQCIGVAILFAATMVETKDSKVLPKRLATFANKMKALL